MDTDEDFAKELERGLEQFDGKETEKVDDETQRTRMGLGLTGLEQEEVITPRGSPYIDRPSKHSGAAAFVHIAPSSTTPATSQFRGTPGMSPASMANSPRPGFESNLLSSWKPPAQRNNMAIAYDEDDDDDDDDDDEEESEEEEDDEEEDDDQDLEAFARQLEGSLMEPNTPKEENQNTAPQTSSRPRRASARGKVR